MRRIAHTIAIGCLLTAAAGSAAAWAESAKTPVGPTVGTTPAVTPPASAADDFNFPKPHGAPDGRISGGTRGVHPLFPSSGSTTSATPAPAATGTGPAVKPPAQPVSTATHAVQ